MLRSPSCPERSVRAEKGLGRSQKGSVRAQKVLGRDHSLPGPALPRSAGMRTERSAAPRALRTESSAAGGCRSLTEMQTDLQMSHRVQGHKNSVHCMSYMCASPGSVLIEPSLLSQVHLIHRGNIVCSGAAD